MALDIELYRRTIYAPQIRKGQAPRRISVFDMQPEGATRTLVFLHGFGGGATQWLYQLQFFGQHLRVIAPDLRGHGLSDDPHGVPYTMNGLVDDLELVLDALHVQEPFHLIAHSFGGAVATEYALRRPENIRGLVLVGVPSHFIVRPLLRRLMNIPDPIFSWVANKIKVALYAPQRTIKAMHDRVMSVWRGSERMQQLRVPTLVILGHRDTVFLRQDYDDVPRSIPGAQQVVIPVSAHLVQLERPDAVNRAIRRFIEPKQPPARAGKSGGLPVLEGTGTLGKDQTVLAVSQIAQNPRTSLATRLAETPWLQHYDGDVPEQVPLSKQLLHDLLSNAARTFPERTAIIFFGQKISYRELDLLSNRFAYALRQLGIKPGDRVAILLPNIPQCIIAFYGILKAGGVVVLGSPLSNETEISYQLRDAAAQILLTLTSYHPIVERVCANTEIKHVITTDVREYLPIRQRVQLARLVSDLGPHGSTARVANAVKTEDRAASLDASDNPPSPAAACTFQSHSLQPLLRRQTPLPLESGVVSADLALLQYTSGTTDTPKGVMLSHSNMVMNVVQIRHWMPEARHGKEVLLCVLPLSHSYGITDCMNLSIALAASLVLLPTTRIDEILEAIKQTHPSIFPGVPALYLAIANYPRVRSYGISAIRTCISGSAPLPVEVQEAFEKLTRGRLVEGYGLTEASPVTHSNPLKGERRVGSIGIPLSSTNARIVDLKTGEPLPPDEVGELLIKGPQVMQGYWQMPDETANVLRDGWLHTGDLASMDEDGFFTIVDRKKDLILSGPYNVYPRDVEEVLYEHPKVLEVAVVSTSSESGEGSRTSPFIKAVVVLKRGEHATADELLALCRERLDAYKVPRQIEFRTELPKNFVGKVLRRLLIEA